MQRNSDEIVQNENVASGRTVSQLDEPGSCIDSIDSDTAIDPQMSKMEKANSLGRQLFQRLRPSSKKYKLDNPSTIGKHDVDEPVVSADSIDIEGNPKFSQMEKTNSLGKMFQKMRSSNNKKVQQKRPSTAVSATNTKGFQNFVRGIWQKDTQILADEIAVAEKFEEININVNQSVDNAVVDVQNEEK